MKVAIDVKSRDEANAVKAAMNDPVTRAMVLVIGHLLPLPSDRARERVLHYVKDRLDEEAEARKVAVDENAS